MEAMSVEVQRALITWDFQQSQPIYILILGFAITFFLAFAVGANDAANSWATSVGAGTVSLGWAYALGSIFETLGATFVSGFVIQNLVEGIINIDLYRGFNVSLDSDDQVSLLEIRNVSEAGLLQEKVLMLGALSTLLSSTFWQISAIYLSLPVSGSHSIVSGLIGFTLVAHGSEGVNWSKTGWIFLGWFLSPLISLLLTAILYSPIYFLVVKSRNPYSVISKIFYSFVIGLTFSINCATVLTTGDYFYRVLGVSSSWTGGRGLFYLVSLWLGGMIAVMVYLLVIPCIIKTNGDFALRCDCCAQSAVGGEGRSSPVSVIRNSVGNN